MSYLFFGQLMGGGRGGAWVRSSPTGNARESGRMERIGKESEGEWEGWGVKGGWHEITIKTGRNLS
jgi:hypothetical protein